MKISNLRETKNEELKNIVIKFLTENFMFIIQIWLKISKVRNIWIQHSAIIVKVVDKTQRDTIITNKTVIKEYRILLNLDLTPLQVEEKKRSLQKSKKFKKSDFIHMMVNQLLLKGKNNYLAIQELEYDQYKRSIYNKVYEYTSDLEDVGHRQHCGDLKTREQYYWKDTKFNFDGLHLKS